MDRIDVLIDATSALQEFTKTRDPRAFKEYKALMNLAFKAGHEEDDTLSPEFRKIVEEELRWLKQTTRGKKPTKPQWMKFCNAVAERIAESAQVEFNKQIDVMYLSGMETAADDLGIKTVVLGGRHQRFIDQLKSGEGVAQTFSGFSQKVSNQLKEIVLDSFEQGITSSAHIATRMVQEVGWQARARLERIARAETWKAMESAKMNMYAEVEEEMGEKFRYRFGKVKDQRTCDLCNHIMDSMPREGMELEDLREFIIQASTTPPYGRPSWDPTRDGGWPMPHPGCRHGTIRVLDVATTYIPTAQKPRQTARQVRKAWVDYTGPAGGKGWRNTATNRVIYAARMPGKRTRDRPPAPVPIAPHYDIMDEVGDLYRNYIRAFEQDPSSPATRIALQTYTNAVMQRPHDRLHADHVTHVMTSLTDEQRKILDSIIRDPRRQRAGMQKAHSLAHKADELATKHFPYLEAHDAVDYVDNVAHIAYDVRAIPDGTPIPTPSPQAKKWADQNGYLLRTVVFVLKPTTYDAYFLDNDGSLKPITGVGG